MCNLREKTTKPKIQTKFNYYLNNIIVLDYIFIIFLCYSIVYESPVFCKNTCLTLAYSTDCITVYSICRYY